MGFKEDRKGSVLVFLAALLLFNPAANALPGEMSDLSVDQAIAIAMNKNPQVLAAQQQVVAAEVQMEQQSNWLARSLTANLGYNPNGMTQGGIGIAVNVGDLLNGFQQGKASAANLNIARNNLRQVKLSVAAGVTAAHADYQNQKRIAAIRLEAIKAAKSDSAVIERLFARGNATIGDLAKVRLAASQSRIDLSESEGNLQKAWMILVQQMGDSEWLEKLK